MLVSTYLLFSKPSDVIKVFSSNTGREYLKDALDDLKLIKEYANEYLNKSSKSIRFGINTKEVMDIAYSYHYYTTTGKCQRCDYVGDTEEFTYNKSMLPFNQKTISEALQDIDSADFMVEPEFDSFVKDWLRESKTIRPINKLYALGYDNAGNFGFYKPIIDMSKGINLVNPKTLDLLMSLLKYANSVDLNSDTAITVIDNAIIALMNVLGAPLNSNIVFGVSYNKLNNKTTKMAFGNTPKSAVKLDVTEQALKDTQDKFVGNLVSYDSRYDEYLNKLYADCSTIFNARYDNIAERELPMNSTEFIEFYEDWLIENCNAEVDYNGDIVRNSSLIQFINKVYERITEIKNLKNVFNSVLGFIKLYSILSFLTPDSINSTLGLNFSREDYLLTASELYEFFCIPFMSCSVDFDILYGMQNNINISSENNSLEPPSSELVKFAFLTARTADSVSYRRKQLDERINA